MTLMTTPPEHGPDDDFNRWLRRRAEELGLLHPTAGPVIPEPRLGLFARLRSALRRMTGRNRGGANV